MKANRSPNMLRCRLSACALALGLAFASATESRRRDPSELAKLAQQQRSDSGDNSPKVYEDEDFSFRIPAGWKVLRTDLSRDLLVELLKDYPGIAQLPERGHGLLLTKNGYALDLNNGAGQTSPIPGGRFFEAFRMPWLRDVSDIWGCSGYLLEKQEPAARKLLFFNMVFGPLDSGARKTCGIPNDLVFERRWFAGYFSTEKGMWLFDSDGTDCAEKAYTLTSGAKTPAELPSADDPILKKIIGEATDIVASIHYKRCPPVRIPVDSLTKEPRA